jgi:putative DNA primase/helicase
LEEDSASKLIEELLGILNWMIKGCLDWQKPDLNRPQLVFDQVSSYRTEVDSITEFIDCKFRVEADLKYLDSKLHEAFRHYC